jgi:CheY-like chemotaxis protein
MSEKPSAKKILIADDEDLVREVIIEALSDSGFTVLEARDGSEALTVLSQFASEIGVVILDMNMPRKDGLQTFLELREHYPHLPVLLATGDEGDARIPKLVERGLNGILLKPYRLAELRKKVTDNLQT